MSDVCKHCTNAGCLDACPTGALIRRSSGPSCSSPTSATAAATACRRAPSGSSTATPTTAAPPSARSATTGSRTGWSPRARRPARPTRSSSGRSTSCARSRRSERRALHERGVSARVPVRRARRARGRAGRRPRRLLPAHRAARELRPARAGRLADPGERHPRHADRDGRGPAGRRRAWPPRSCGSGGDERLARHHASRRRAGRARLREKSGEKVDLHIGLWKDGRWSYLYGEDTKYGGEMPDLEAIREASQRARTGPLPDQVARPGDQGAGVDLGGAALLLVRRYRGRLVVRGAGLRLGGRRGIGARSRARSRWPRWRLRRYC